MIKMLPEEVLKSCGLTKNEAKVYLSLLRLGNATAAEITKESHVHRVNVYDALERLREKGLISSIFQAKKRIFEPASPEHMQNLIKEKEALLNEIMPSLKQDYKSRNEKQQVHHFFGPEGVMRAYYMMLDENQTIYAMGGSGLNRKLLAHRHDMWNRERLRRGIKGKGLYYEFTRGDSTKSWTDSSMQIRFIPDSYKTVGMVDICGNLIVNLIPTDENIMAIVIENKTLAETYRQFFKFLWNHAKP